MPTEEDLRATFRGLATQAPDADTVLTALRTREASHRPRWPRLVAPLAAAVAVMVVAGISVALSGGGQARHPAPSPTALLKRAPRSYVELISAEPGYTRPCRVPGAHNVCYDYAVVRNTLTGATLAKIYPPRPFLSFDAVAGAADDHTFVLSASAGQPLNGFQPLKFFLLRVNPSTGAATLTAAPIPEMPKSEYLVGMALSPNGTDLAISVQTGKPSYKLARVSVYSLATGAERSWQAHGYLGEGEYDSQALSWSRGGILAFNWTGNKPASGVYLLRTAAASGNLFADSRRAVRALSIPSSKGLRVPYTYSYFNSDGVLTADGTKIVFPVVTEHVSECPKLKPNPNPNPKLVSLCGPFKYSDTVSFEEFSATTGRLIRILDRTAITDSATFNYVEWTNPSGSLLVVYAPTAGGHRTVLGMLGTSRFVPIPGAPPSFTTSLAF